jgi:hypothetical protein
VGGFNEFRENEIQKYVPVAHGPRTCESDRAIDKYKI